MDPSAPLKRSVPEHCWHDGRVTINDRIEVGRRVLTRASRAGWRLEQAEPAGHMDAVSGR
jgi:hypothetical protein